MLGVFGQRFRLSLSVSQNGLRSTYKSTDATTIRPPRLNLLAAATMAALSVRCGAYGAPFYELPVDVLPLIFAQFDDLRDWHSCTLVNRLFCRLATPFLYRTLDSRVISKVSPEVLVENITSADQTRLFDIIRHLPLLRGRCLHDMYAMLRKQVSLPNVQIRVWLIFSGAMYGGMLDYYPDIIENTFAALALCSNLRSLTWIEEDASAPEILPALLDTVRVLPLCALTIRTHSDIGAEAWAQITALEGIRRIALWCMNGPPRTLHGKIAPLGTTLTHLELGVSAFAYHPSERTCLPFPSPF